MESVDQRVNIQQQQLVILCCFRWLNLFVGPVAGDKGAYASAAAPPEQRAPPAVREDRRQHTAHGAPPHRQQPPPAEEEDDANDYDSDEASEFPVLWWVWFYFIQSIPSFFNPCR